VDDPRLVEGVEAARRVAEERREEPLAAGGELGRERGEVASLDPLHGVVGDPLRLARGEDLDDVRMVAAREGADLAAEALEREGVGGDRRGEALQRDEPPEALLPHEVDGAHAAGAEDREDPVVPEEVGAGALDVEVRLGRRRVGGGGRGRGPGALARAEEGGEVGVERGERGGERPPAERLAREVVEVLRGAAAAVEEEGARAEVALVDEHPRRERRRVARRAEEARAPRRLDAGEERRRGRVVVLGRARGAVADRLVPVGGERVEEPPRADGARRGAPVLPDLGEEGERGEERRVGARGPLERERGDPAPERGVRERRGVVGRARREGEAHGRLPREVGRVVALLRRLRGARPPDDRRDGARRLARGEGLHGAR
jgi:hypothetical protein